MSDVPSPALILPARKPRRARAHRARDWLFTLFDFDDAQRLHERISRFARFHVFQVEQCPETDRLHVQGFLQLASPKSLASVKKALGSTTVHLEARKGTVREAIAYCSKEETRHSPPLSAGRPSYQGKRTDISDFRDAVLDGATELQLLEEHPDCLAKFPRFAHTVRRISATSRAASIMQDGRRVYVLVGPPGSGKSSFAWRHFGDDLWSFPVGGSSSSAFFDGYTGQRHVLLDEFYGNIPFQVLNQITDRYPVNVEVKGASTAWVPEVILIASTAPPEEWYPSVYEKRPEVVDAVLRRISATISFPLFPTFL